MQEGEQVREHALQRETGEGGGGRYMLPSGLRVALRREEGVGGGAFSAYHGPFLYSKHGA